MTPRAGAFCATTLAPRDKRKEKVYLNTCPGKLLPPATQAQTRPVDRNGGECGDDAYSDGPTTRTVCDHDEWKNIDWREPFFLAVGSSNNPAFNAPGKYWHTIETKSDPVRRDVIDACPTRGRMGRAEN